MVHEPNIGGQRSFTRRSPYNVPHACDHSLPSSASLCPKLENRRTFRQEYGERQDEIGVIPTPIQQSNVRRGRLLTFLIQFVKLWRGVDSH
jgi:hypothetical protein